MMVGARKKTSELLEAHRSASGLGHAIDVFLITLILANVVVIVLETVPSISTHYRQALVYFEVFSVAIFTIEYVLRLWSCVEEPVKGLGGTTWTRKRWALSPLGVIDLLAILPFYVFLFIPDSEMSLLLLRVFRGLRLLRVFKLGRYSAALNILFAVLKREARVLAVTTLILSAVLLLASWGIYILEKNIQPDSFGSVPAAMWWAVITLTTVGYGDVIPVTDGGRMFAGLISLIGIGMAALPAGILASGFSTEIHRRTNTFERAVNLSLADGIMSQHEALELETLREELGISKEEASNVIQDAERKLHPPDHCPHCGKNL